jgi:hypothetical protein
MKGKFVNTQIRITCASSTRSKKTAKLAATGQDFLKGNELIWTKGTTEHAVKSIKLVA